ncbi:MAG: HEAT repeat domain-containing protein [Chitinophagaceae bacterium]|nr:HEAT repeat domain-containing protein [Chitinophagaceae bacterium]
MNKSRQYFNNLHFLKSMMLCNEMNFYILFVIVLFAFGCQQKQGGQNNLKGMQVPEGYVIEEVVDSNLISYPMFASFDNQGRLFLCESNGETISTEDHLKKPPYHIRMLEDVDGDGKFEKSTIFADSLTYPKGAVFYQGSLYVASAPYLIKLTDTNGDGVADQREILLSGWILNHNAAAFGGPFLGPDGWLYMTDARRGFDIVTKEGTELKGKATRIWRCRPDGTGLEAFCGGGYDNAIELIFMPGGEAIGTMTYFTDPMNGFRDALMHWEYGGVYPKPQQVIQDDKLKLTGDLMPTMTKLPRIAHSGLMRYESRALGDTFTGNLFSAQFNTGRIMRHIITADGATFQTKDEPFMTATHPDIHPTDVLEDGDGSMLVVNTGGWFIAGCPLSVVAKKDVRAGIFRIRKTGAKPVDDPWGRKLDISKMAPADLVRYVQDPRWAVRNQAVEQLVLLGKPAIDEINKGLLTSENEKVRTAGVFLLSRIHEPEAMDIVRGALNDKSPIVRTASARVLGLARDKQAVPQLMELVQSDKAPVRRQAATALGQIGDVTAVEALVKAAANPDDRFVEHAIIYALISLKTPEPLVGSLQQDNANIRKAALIALDQMDGSPLKKEQLVQLLNSGDNNLQQTAIWVVLHHPEWADVVVQYVKKGLEKNEITDDQLSAIKNLMIRFSGSPGIQEFIGGRLADQQISEKQRLLLMDVINQAEVKKIPDSWTRQLNRLLHSAEPEVQSQVLNVIKSRRISSFNKELDQIAADGKASVDFRMKALSARLMSDSKLTEEQFGLLLNFLGPKNESPVRQEASRLLAQSKLSESQLVTLANQAVATADMFLLPNLVNVYRGGNDEEAGKALINALEGGKERLDNLSVTDMQKLFETYPPTVQSAAGSLIDILKEKQAARLAELEKIQSQLTRGDVGAGRQLFFGKATCFTCHAVTGQGGDFGPDLSNIGEIRSRHDILEAILYPSASFAREYETSKVNTKNGSFTGIVKEQLPDAIILSAGPGSSVRILRSDIVSIEPETVSLMPPGLLQSLSIEEISDLIAYLESLPSGLGQIGKH